MTTQKIAAVTGANRGLGKGTALALAKKGYFVYLLGRDMKTLRELTNVLTKESLSVDAFELDVTNESAIRGFVEHIKSKQNRLDVLVNNAGVFLEHSTDPNSGSSPLTVPSEVVLKTFNINTMGPYRLSQAVLPLMQKNGYGRIVNVSSGMGALMGMERGHPGYRISKTALNALTRVLAAELAGTPIKINSVCPGWVKTDMGGPNAQRSIEQGVQGILWAATLGDDGPSGGFFRDGIPIDW